MDLTKVKANNRLASETLDILRRGNFTTSQGTFIIKSNLEASVKGARLYTPDEVNTLEVPASSNYETVIEVTDETTVSAARRLREEFDRVSALNFASAKRPGGGWLNKGTAQEESIAFSSGLYPTIAQMKEMYTYNEKLDALYSDYMIYSPSVPMFRDDDYKLTKPFTCSVITSPAPNAGVLDNSLQDKLAKVMKNRIERILTVAATHSDEALVLGAFGCGVFKNNPADVASFFADALNGSFKGVFKKVTFAIYDKSPSQSTLNTFKSKFAN